MSAGECQTKNTKNYEEEKEEKIVALDEGGFLNAIMDDLKSMTCFPFSFFLFDTI